MRAFILRAFIVVGYIIVLITAGGIALAKYGPLRPGSVVFPLQDFAEQQFGAIYRNPMVKASYLLDLAERRVNNLISNTGSAYEYTSMEYLDKSFDQAVLAISALPQIESESLRFRLTGLSAQADQALSQLKFAPVEHAANYNALVAKMQTIEHMAGTVTVQNNELVLLPAIVVGTPQAIQSGLKTINSAPGLIPWPPGSQGAIHNFYPLTGKHASLTCINCHNEAVYFGTPTQCIDCHILKTPIPHYPGDCGLCHTTLDWADIHFDHTVVSSMACSACHEKDKPADHFNGPCGACHITENWTTVTFDHAVAGAVDCISCHAQKAPANHYAGQCSNCHNTSNWTSVVFDHTGFTDCSSCHAKDTPANHYAGQCSNCHSTSGGWANAHFNHSGFTDCIGCHAAKAPGGHYPGQCSNCHSTNSWGGAVFNHAGFTDCEGCHSGNAPANHYPYQCSLCHSTNSWGGANFGHSGSYPDCISCHQKDRPGGHDPGQCSNCHNTNNWGDGGDGGGGLAMTVGPNSLFVDCSACHRINIASVGEGNKQ